MHESDEDKVYLCCSNLRAGLKKYYTWFLPLQIVKGSDFRKQLSASRQQLTRTMATFLPTNLFPFQHDLLFPATQILVKQFNYLRNTVQPLTEFLEYITSGFFFLTQPIKISLADAAGISLGMRT